MAFSAQYMRRCATHTLAGRQAGLAGRAVRIPGIYRNNANVPPAALEMSPIDDHRRGLDAVRREHGGSTRSLIGNGKSEVEIAADLQSGFHGCKTKSARQRVLGEQSSLNHVRFYFIKRRNDQFVRRVPE